MKSFLQKTTVLLIILIWTITAFGQESSIYTTGFEAAESFTAGTTYNNTTIKYDGPTGQQWGTYYGTASTTGPISGLMSMQMRWYLSAPANLGYTFTDFELANVTKVNFLASSTLGLNVIVSYSTDGGTSYVGETLFTLTNSAAPYTYNISATGEFANVKVKFQMSLPDPIPTGTSRLYIDDVEIFGITGGGSQVETPYFSPLGGNYFEAVDVSILTNTADANIFYSTVSNTGPWTAYTSPLNISNTTTLWAYATKAGLDDSNVSSATYNFPAVIEVSSISDLRSGLTDGTIYKLTSEAVLTYQQTFRNKKWIQDANAGIEIDDPNPKIITTTYNINDGITGIIGTLNRTNNMLEFKPVADPGPATSINNVPVVVTRTIATLTEADQGRLVRINDVMFDALDFGFNFNTGTNYTIDDPSGFGVFRTEFWEADYIGTLIPETSINLTAIVREYIGTLQVTARSLADFGSLSTDATLSAFSLSGQNVLGLSGLLVNNPTTDPGATLMVNDFTGFAGIVATPASASASRVVTLNGTTIAEGNLPTQPISQNDVIVVTVTAEDGTTTNYYKITAVLSTATPVIATSGTLLDYKSVYTNNVSNVQFYYVSATDLASDLTITAPEHFLVSLNCNSGFASSLSITPTAGEIATTRVYVRFSPTSLGAKSGNISNAASGAISVNIAASGTGIANQIPAGYYTTATGTEGVLLAELHNIIRGHNRVSYASIWTHFSSTDAKYNGKVWDNYSDIQCSEPPYEFTFGADQDTGLDAPNEGIYYNREHSWPASWWGGSDTDTMYTDLHQVYPADKFVNAARESWPFGTVNSPTWTSDNGSKKGNNSYGTGYSGTAFEPTDEYKGDFARTYFYMVTRYNSRLASWSTNPNVQNVIDGTAFPAFETWALDMLLEWHNNDPVSQKEIIRNNAIYAQQGNRNPFIDNPAFVDMIWGEPIGPTEVTSIAELRQQVADGITTYHLTSEAVLTFQHYNRNKKYIQDLDGQAAIEIDDPSGIITTTYNLYDGITGIKGTLSYYNNLLQFTPVENTAAPTSTGILVVPEIKTLNQLTSDDQGKLIQVKNVDFVETGLFANGISYNISDPSGALIFRTQFYNVDYITTDIPLSTQHITCLVLQYQDIIQIAARFLADFQDATNLPGDANNDGFVNVIDLVWIIAHLNSSTPDGFNFENADVNGDTVINISDLTALIDIILEMTK